MGAVESSPEASPSEEGPTPMDDELRGLLARNYRPGPEERSPRHLKHFADVHSPTLRDELNYQLSLVPGADLRGECSHCRGPPDGGMRIREAFISGSVADRIGWVVINDYKYSLKSDNDFMLRLNIADELAAEHVSGDAQPCLAPTEHESYFRVLRGRSRRCSHAGRLELAAGQVRAVLEDAVRRHRPQRPPQINGPAVTFHDGHGDIDCVSCVQVASEAAVPWLKALRRRRRPAGWPSDALLRELAGPLHLVPVGPRPGDDSLWRLSFSRPEALLVQGLPPRPRFCLMLLKTLRIGRRQEVSLVSSYYLKTCVFWLCEERRDWEDTLDALHVVLAMLETSVADGHLPCYFWEKLNVLRHPTEERLAALRKEVRHFRRKLNRWLFLMLTTMKPGPIRF